MTDLSLLRTAVMQSPFDRALQMALADELIEREGLSKFKALRQSLCFARATKYARWVSKWSRRIWAANRLRSSIGYYIRLGLELNYVHGMRIYILSNCSSPRFVGWDFFVDTDGDEYFPHRITVGAKWLENREEAILRFHAARMREQRKVRKQIENEPLESH